MDRLVLLLNALKEFKFYHTLLTSFIAGAFVIGTLTGNAGADNLKELAFIVVTFWYSQSATERAVNATIQRIKHE